MGEFRVVTIDERGHGGTPADGPFDYWDVARDVLALLDELGIGWAAVVGTSQGGFIGLRMALLAPGQRALIVKPAIDTKSPAVLSRIGVDRVVDLVAGPDVPVRERVLACRVPRVDCVLVDEAQFLTPGQVDDLFRLAVDDGVPVIAYGLRSDFRTRGFPGSIRLMEIAHSIEELKTICRCGRKAILNARTVDGRFTLSGDQVAIEGDVGYESMCGSCYIREFDWSPV